MNLDNNQSSLIISVHIYKTAGTTLHSIIDRNFSQDEILYASIVGLQNAEQRLINDEDLNKGKYRLVHGHFPYGWHKYFKKPHKYMTFLRDPIKRVISSYYYYKNFEGGHNHKYAKDKTIEEFINCSEILEMDNGMTRFISGDFLTPFGELPIEVYNQAIINLDKHFSFVGITERFDDSLVLLGDVLGWKKLYYQSKNVTPRYESSYSDALLNKIKERNQYDIMLYKYALKRFENQYSSINNLKIRRLMFCLSNLFYRKIHPVYSIIFRSR